MTQTKKKSKRDIVLILEGGSIQGVFSAGILTYLEENTNIKDRIHSVYGASSGAHNGAYFLSNKTKTGSKIYLDYLINLHENDGNRDSSFIKKPNFFSGIYKLLNFFIFKKQFGIMDLDAVKKIEQTDGFKLDLNKIKNSKMNFYAAVFNKETLKYEYIDAKKDTLNSLAFSSRIVPYSRYTTKNNKYYDGSSTLDIKYLDVIKKHKDKNIIYIFNKKKTMWYYLLFSPFFIIDLLFKSRFFGIDYFMEYGTNLFINDSTIHSYDEFKHVHVFYPDKFILPNCNKYKKVLAYYKHGFEKGKKIEQLINKL